MKNALLVLSGGMDSTTLLYDRADEIALAVSFDYGSNHNDCEIPFAKLHCEKLGIPHITIPLKFMHDYFKSSLLSGADAIPEGTYAGITIDAPYTNISKADIARRGKMLGIDYAQTWSCYKGGKIHCGKCATCLERKAALAEAGIEDTTEYEG